MDPTDEQLAQRARDGCLESFEELVRRHEGRLRQFLHQRTACREEAKDLTQETFVRAWRNIRRYNPRHRFATWLFTIARRQAINHWRSRPAPTAELEDTHAVPPPAPTETADLWRVARSVLSEKQFTALWLKYAEELSVRDIARAMQLTGIHVKVLLHRGRRQLAGTLTSPASKEIRHELFPGTMENFPGRG